MSEVPHVLWFGMRNLGKALTWLGVEACSAGSLLSLTSLLTSDDTREAHIFLESDQLLTLYRCSGGRVGPIPYSLLLSSLELSGSTIYEP